MPVPWKATFPSTKRPRGNWKSSCPTAAAFVLELEAHEALLERMDVPDHKATRAVSVLLDHWAQLAHLAQLGALDLLDQLVPLATTA
uniref:Uncharacterized protein LOC116951689 isoform X3 n=1 Tax=Petromyzon marinus TaxID=7757 RepID=A0AAJ7U0I1_PETMA|nr:uncharacterized protein LOC116951689 isoform X3 [Petromyzon marinus]